MDLSKLTTGDKVIAGRGIALFIFSFFPGSGSTPASASSAENGWYSIFLAGRHPVLLGVAMVAS